jgi:hypothetical protein
VKLRHRESTVPDKRDPKRLAGARFIIFGWHSASPVLKGIVSKFTLKFWMCQKCGKMKDSRKKKITTSAVE